jgi:hypothetical protein
MWNTLAYCIISTLDPVIKCAEFLEWKHSSLLCHINNHIGTRLHSTKCSLPKIWNTLAYYVISTMASALEYTLQSTAFQNMKHSSLLHYVNNDRGTSSRSKKCGIPKLWNTLAYYIISAMTWSLESAKKLLNSKIVKHSSLLRHTNNDCDTRKCSKICWIPRLWNALAYCIIPTMIVTLDPALNSAEFQDCETLQLITSWAPEPAQKSADFFYCQTL